MAKTKMPVWQKALLWLLGLAFSFAFFLIVPEILTAPPPTPTPLPTAVPPTSTPVLPTPTEQSVAVATQAPQSNPTVLPTATPQTPCEWVPNADKVAMPPAVLPNCFSDLMRFGISQDEGRLLFYTSSQRLPGYYGVSKLIGSASSAEVAVNVTSLQTSRFLVALAASDELPNQDSVGVRIHSDDGENFFVKVVTFSTMRGERELSITPAYENWGKRFVVRFEMSGSKVDIYVNGILLNQVQHGFANRYLFVGYQSMPVSGVPIWLDVAAEVGE